MSRRRGISVLTIMENPPNSIIEQKIDSINHPLLSSPVVNHFLTYLSLPTFGSAATVCKKWHHETLTGSKATYVWERGVRQGEIADGRHSSFWSSMCDMRNCIADHSTAGSLVNCLKNDKHRRGSLFSISSGGSLSFSKRKGIFLRLQAWAAAAIIQNISLRADTWQAKLATVVVGAVISFQSRYDLNGSSRSRKRFFDSVTSVTYSYRISYCSSIR
jgi:hypothetical protein